MATIGGSGAETPGADRPSASLGLARHSLGSESASDPGHLLGMQLAVDGHGGEAGAPDAVEQRAGTPGSSPSPARRGRPGAGRGARRSAPAMCCTWASKRGIAERALFPGHGRPTGHTLRDGLQRQREVHGTGGPEFRARKTLPPAGVGEASCRAYCPAVARQSPCKARNSSRQITRALQLVTVYHACASSSFRICKQRHIRLTSDEHSPASKANPRMNNPNFG